MPRELITVQVGQCGMQLGTKFWDMALREHAQALAENSQPNSTPLFDEALSSFFRNVQPLSSGGVAEMPYDPLNPTPIYSLRARAVCIDMEEGVLNQLQRSPMGELFDNNQFVRSVSGAGNNWAHGHCEYGPQYAPDILEAVRVTAEKCDSLQSFFVMHSLGGGTGSGLGSYLLHLLEDAFPHVYRFNVAVCPAEDDDVVTSPYNSVLALEQLRRHSDCVLPIDNQALSKLANRAMQAAGCPVPADTHPYAQMNTVVGQTLTALTAPIRFPGALNVDLNELTMNLVPFPSMHFVIPSLAPISPLASPSPSSSSSTSASSRLTAVAPRHLDQLYADILHPDHCLLSVDPRKHTYLALGVFTRGRNVQITDVNRNIAKLKACVRMAPWNADGFKIGLCSQPGVGEGMERSVLGLSNNCAIVGVFKRMSKRFDLLYRRRAHVHHYTQYCSLDEFDSAYDGLQSLVHDYTLAQKTSATPLRRLEPI